MQKFEISDIYSEMMLLTTLDSLQVPSGIQSASRENLLNAAFSVSVVTCKIYRFWDCEIAAMTLLHHR